MERVISIDLITNLFITTPSGRDCMRGKERGLGSGATSSKYRTEASVLAVLHMSLTSRGGTRRAAALLLMKSKHFCNEGGKQTARAI